MSIVARLNPASALMGIAGRRCPVGKGVCLTGLKILSIIRYVADCTLNVTMIFVWNVSLCLKMNFTFCFNYDCFLSGENSITIRTRWSMVSHSSLLYAGCWFVSPHWSMVGCSLSYTG